MENEQKELSVLEKSETLKLDNAKISKNEYTLSLIREALKCGLIDENEEAKLKTKIYDGLASVLDEFTDGKSTSVSQEKANDLLSSFLYNIDAYLISLNDPEKALSELKSKPISSMTMVV